MLTINSECKVYACSINQEEWNFVSGSCNSVSVFFLLCPSHCSQKSEDLYKKASKTSTIKIHEQMSIHMKALS